MTNGNEKLKQRISELEEALRPFAEYIDEFPRGAESDAIGYDTWLSEMRHSVSWIDFDRAARLLSEKERVDG